MYMESDPNLWNPGTGTSTATLCEPFDLGKLLGSHHNIFHHQIELVAGVRAVEDSWPSLTNQAMTFVYVTSCI